MELICIYFARVRMRTVLDFQLITSIEAIGYRGFLTIFVHLFVYCFYRKAK